MLKSTVHRVTFPKEEGLDRYSIAYFCHPLNDVAIESIPSQMVMERSVHSKQHSEKVTAVEYLNKRLRETYGWGKGQNIVPSI